MTRGYVYVITSTVNGKQYVGQTVQSVRARWSQHVSDATRTDRRKGCRALHAAIAKHGPSAFTLHAMVMDARHQSDIDAMETRLIRAFNCMAPNGYNLRVGGSRGRHSLEAREKMSAGQRDRGPASPETRAKLSAAHKGRTNWAKGLTYEQMGRVVTDATRAKLRAAALRQRPVLKGTTQPPEWRAAISAAKTGRKLPAMSAALKAAHARHPQWRLADR